MFVSIMPLVKRCCLLPLLALLLLCGCGSLTTSQAQVSTTPTAQPSPTPTAHPPVQPSPTPTVRPSSFPSYVGKWEVHDALLSINADHTGLESWNAGPCTQSGSAMCNGSAKIMFTENADGSIKGTIQSVSYSQWNGSAVPTGFQASPDDPHAGDTFQLQHSGAHLLYTTWLGKKLSYLNQGNRYWCDSFALKAGWQQCGA